MRYHLKLFRLSIISIILVILMMSCRAISLISDNSSKNAQITPTPEIPTVAIPTLTNMVNQIVFTEEDVKTWINELSTQNPDFKISDPQVSLQNGICTITGNLSTSSTDPLYNLLSGKIDLQFSIRLDENNTPLVTIQSLKLNSTEMPQFVIDQISAMINTSIGSSISKELNGRSIKQITLGDGKIIITID